MIGRVTTPRPRAPERGAAIVLALICTLLIGAIGAALVLTTSAELMIADNFRGSAESLYAADAALQEAIAALRAADDWDAVLSGAAQSPFVDGVAGSGRTLADGSRIDLAQVLDLANCGKPSACSAADMDAVTAARPWGANNPRWQLYAYAPLSTLPVPGLRSPYYVVALVADDGAENDGDPLHDGADAANPGAGVLALRAEAFGPRGAHKSIEAALARDIVSGRAAARVLWWREVR